MNHRKIVIDYRENSLIKLLSNNSWLEKANLKIGDINFSEGNELKLCIERKTIKDLQASIKDSRYRDQKKRMLDVLSKEFIIYLIEGDIQEKNRYINEKIVTSAIFNLIIRDNISVILSKNIQESSYLIENLATRFIYNKPPFNNSKINLSNNIFIKKKGDISVKECFKRQLCQVPGISEIKSNIILQYSNNISELIININKQEDPLKYLSSLNLNIENKNKKLGEKSAQNILNFLGINFKKKS